LPGAQRFPDSPDQRGDDASPTVVMTMGRFVSRRIDDSAPTLAASMR